MENLHVWANSVQNIKIPEKEKIIQKCRRGLFKFGPKVSKVLIFLRKKQIIKNVEEGSFSSRPKCPKYRNSRIKKMPNKAFFNVLRITAKCLGEQDSEIGADGSAHGSRTRWREWGRSPCRAWGHPFQVRLGFRLSSKIPKVNRTISKTQPSTKVGI